jgi:enamine deaminase RidA (YjgF/YER057c/UK114 family)
MSAIDTTLKSLNITLPPAPKPVASYIPFVKTGGGGNLVYLSGQIATKDGKVQFAGPVPTAQSIEQGQEAAKLCIINALAVLKDACNGDLDRVARIVRIGVWVQSAPGFDQQAKVANGASDLLIAIFGDLGKHARAAVGSVALPLNTTVEVEILAELTEP